MASHPAGDRSVYKPLEKPGNFTGDAVKAVILKSDHSYARPAIPTSRSYFDNAPPAAPHLPRRFQGFTPFERG